MNIPAVALSLIIIVKTLGRMDRKKFDDVRAKVYEANPHYQGGATYGSWVFATASFGLAELALIYLAVRIGL